MTSDEIFRKKNQENLFRTQTKIVKKPKQNLTDFQTSEILLNYSENKEKNEEFEDQNFSKKKYFYKYPFKNIDSKYQKTENKTETKDITEKFFESLYAKLVKQHARCGSNCGHLKKFYQRIGFVNKFIQKEEMAMSKNLIDRIPYFNELEDSYYNDFKP